MFCWKDGARGQTAGFILGGGGFSFGLVWETLVQLCGRGRRHVQFGFRADCISTLDVRQVVTAAAREDINCVAALCVSGHRHSVVGLSPEHHGQISDVHGHVPDSVS